jgi:excisionase family DNA binding protein
VKPSEKSNLKSGTADGGNASAVSSFLKLVYTRDEAAEALGISVATLDMMVKRRMIRPAPIGRRVLPRAAKRDK